MLNEVLGDRYFDFYVSSLFNNSFYFSETKNGYKTFKVQDVFVCPDYEAYIEDHLCPLQRAFKKQWTQLQFIFEKCEKSKWFPNGVKVCFANLLDIYELIFLYEDYI